MATFEKATDRAAEDRVAQFLEDRWRVKVGAYGPKSPIDRYLTRMVDGERKVAAIIEIKCRSHAVDHPGYPTLYLSLQKYLNLWQAGWLAQVPAFYVARFTDEIRYINIEQIEPGDVWIKGRRPRAGSANDQEPMIEVDKLHLLEVPVEVSEMIGLEGWGKS